VHEALKRYLDISNQAPIHYMWNLLEPNIETVRRLHRRMRGAKATYDGALWLLRRAKWL